MTEKYYLNRDIDENFMYVYSPNCKAFKTFTMKEKCVCNSFNQEINEWDYISVVTKKKYSEGTVFKAKCSFESYGAPLIVFTDDIQIINGEQIYGHHYEVVAYENGINIWCIDPAPEKKERPINTKKIGHLDFKIEEGEEILIDVTIFKNSITAKIKEYEITVSDDKIPSSFHGGITACEGKNFFSEFMITSNSDK